MWFGDELGSIVCGAYKKGAGAEADRTREKYEKAIQEEKSDKEWKNFVAEIIPKSNY